MSKLSFRARALDAGKPMPVYEAEDIPDLRDFAAINRAVPQMPTGMEKEEESEHHLQRALSAQQVYGTSEVLVIPIPEVDGASNHYEKLYKSDFKQPKQYIHVQAFSMDQEIPDYDMDSEDENWLQKQVKKMEVTPLQFEEMMDRLEKGSGQQVVTLQEAKLLLKEDDDLIIAVYDYWLNKRLRMQHPLIPTVKTEKRDGSTTNNPYVAFRRRTEKMQTRKNRKNDETSYEKMLKLRRDLSRAVTLLEMIKRREKTKKELLQLTIEIVEKRYQVQDFNGALLDEALAQRHKVPSFIPVNQFAPGREWARKKSEDAGYVRKKREYKKRKHKQASAVPSSSNQPTPQLPQYNEVDVLHTDAYTSDDEAISPAMSPSDHEDENDPDGIYAFRRKKGCTYLAPVTGRLGNWPWASREEGGCADPKYRYVLTSLTTPSRCIGFARRRVGRGGRLLLDRGFSKWDDCLTDLDLTSSSSSYSGDYSDIVSHIRDNNWLHFRPRTPPLDDTPQPGTLSPQEMVTEFNIESFQDHQEQLLQMQREQQEQILRYQTTELDSSIDLEHSFSSQPTSRFTLDSATAQFAASAVVNSSTQITPDSVPHVSVGATQLTHTSTTSSLTNGPINNDNKSNVFSTSPAATVLQLNYPILTTSDTTGSQSSVSSSLTSSVVTSMSDVTAMTSSSTSSSGSQPISVVNTSCSLLTPSLLKIPNKNSTTTIQVPVENHDSPSPVNNSIVKDNSAVPMEVT